MKLFQYLLGAITIFAVAFPLIAQQTGLGISNSPSFSRTSGNNCVSQLKDRFGRCPIATTSAFRRLSVGGGGSGGGSGSGGGGK